MSDDKKPREWWLGNEYVDVKGHGKYYSWKRVNPEHPSDVHVIEYSAYAALQKQNEELRKDYFEEREFIRQQKAEIEKLQKENEDLKEFNKLLVEEIKAMKHPEYDPYKHEKENASLLAQLKLAVEAIENHHKTWAMDGEQIFCMAECKDLCETLAKIKARHDL